MWLQYLSLWLDYNDFRPSPQLAEAKCCQLPCFDNKRVPCQRGSDRWTEELEAKAEVWNWGNRETTAGVGHITFSPLDVSRDLKSTVPRTHNLPVCQSLVDDLHSKLFPEFFDDYVHNSTLFARLYNHASQLLNHIILHLDGQNLFETGRPISHLFADMIACIHFLRNKVGMVDEPGNMNKDVHEITDARTAFWKGIFSMCLLLSSIT